MVDLSSAPAALGQLCPVLCPSAAPAWTLHDLPQLCMALTDLREGTLVLRALEAGAPEGVSQEAVFWMVEEMGEQG